MKLPMLSEQDKVAEIRRLYFTTTKDTIQDDLARALDSVEVDARRNRARTRGRLHGGPGADAVGLGRRRVERAKKESL